MSNLTESPAVCHLSLECNKILCCVSAESIRRTFQVEISLDSCSKVMLIKLERLAIKVDLLDYQFGMYHTYWNYSAKTCYNYTLRLEVAPSQKRKSLDMLYVCNFLFHLYWVFRSPELHRWLIAIDRWCPFLTSW